MRNGILLIFSVLFCACSTTPEDVVIDGILEVPENRDNPNSRTLNLVYKVLKAKDTTFGKAPIVFLMGGPGGATLVMEGFWKNHPLRNGRDIVLMDQRGTGASEANCTESSDDLFAIMRQDLEIDEDVKASSDVLNECKEIIRKKGVDLAGYNSRENAADFEDLRKALGYKKWNLFGASYGSRLGLTIMRDFPESVRSAVFAGVLAPETDLLNSSIQNFENSLFSVLERCKKNEDCNSRYPNLKEGLLKALEKLQSDPLYFEYNGKPFVLNPQDAFIVLSVPLYDRRTIGNIPLLIEALENGETEPIKNAVKSVENFTKLINLPMHYSFQAYEEIPFFDSAALENSIEKSEIRVAVAFHDLATKFLIDWHPFRATNFEDQPVVSEIPTLLASGALDHATPISNAKEALKHLKNGYEIIFPDEAHNLYNPCFFKIAKDFLNDPFQKPHSACSTERNPIKWNLSNSLQ